MSDNQLLYEIERYVRAVPYIQRMDNTAAMHLADEVAAKFVKDKSVRWWWESLNEGSRAVVYGSDDGLTKLKQIVGVDSECTLFVTDDEFPPWPAFSAKSRTIIDLLGEHRYFEFLLVSNSLDWCVFDTHENTLILTGSLARAKI